MCYSEHFYFISKENIERKEKDMSYENLELKIPIESPGYKKQSDFVIQSINSIMAEAISSGKNKIIIDTNLKLGIPMENVNKIAGPFIEAWAYEIFDESNSKDNKYDLINVEPCGRLHLADVILQFKRNSTKKIGVTGNVDVKATSIDIKGSGKAPNITSYAKIRTAYLEDPDFIFVILSIKHRVYSVRDEKTKMMKGIMEVMSSHAYDLKYLSDSDISYNPALGTGQIQIRDIHYVTLVDRTAAEFCKLLDLKFLASNKGYNQWLKYALQNKWIKS